MCQNVNAQLGNPIINITFGQDSINPGPPMDPKYTVLSYSPQACPPPGSYTVTNTLFRCPETRMGRSIDNTPFSSYGYMMSVIDTTSLTDRFLFIDTIKENLCPGTMYEFSVALLNTAIPTYCNAADVHLPNFSLTVENDAGVIIQATNTGPMNFDYVPPPPPTPTTPKFHIYKVDFILPAGVDVLVLKIKDRAAFHSPCTYYYAVDDIKFSASGPISKIAFDGAESENVKAVCFQDNKSISMSGTLGPGFINPVVRWQQSIDSGITWTDIPGATGYNYTGTFSVPDTFLFRLRGSEAGKVSNPNCSIVSNTLRVEVNGIPSDIKITNNSPVCAGGNLQFDAEGGASYTWSGPNGFFDNIASPNIPNTVLADSGIYYAVIKTFGGCTTTASTTVKIIGFNIKITGDRSICKGKSVQLNIEGGTSYLWSPAAGLSNAAIANPSASPDVTTTYKVTATDEFGCSNSGSVTVKLLNTVAVKAAISGAQFICQPSDTAHFINLSEGGITYASWTFDNGQTSSLFNPPVQNYLVDASRSDYSVRLIVTDSAGCMDTAYHVMKVESNCYIAVPTAFTPNGDGLNDYLYPLNAFKATNLTFKVFNRLGQLVFETNDWTKKWDGNVNGEPQPLGVYVWMLNYTDGNKKEVSLKGSTMLIR
jgi:gliding motility-associated-like protein